MKNKIANLTPSWRTIDQDFESQRKAYRKKKALERWMKSNFPEDIEGKYSFDDLGESCIRCFIYLRPDDSQSVVNFLKWIAKQKKNRFKAEKFFRKDKGYFAYKLEREYGFYNNYMILIEDAANIDGCKMKKKRKMQTVFVTDCENETVTL